MGAETNCTVREDGQHCSHWYDGQPCCDCGDAMNFGEALEQLREGAKVQRIGWNGKGMWIVLQEGYPDGIPINANTAKATGLPEGTVRKFSPYLMIKAADDTFVPWLPSQADILAIDWQVAD